MENLTCSSRPQESVKVGNSFGAFHMGDTDPAVAVTFGYLLKHPVIKLYAYNVQIEFETKAQSLPSNNIAGVFRIYALTFVYQYIHDLATLATSDLRTYFPMPALPS